MDISLEKVFNPNSIAVIGASEVAGKGLREKDQESS